MIVRQFVVTLELPDGEPPSHDAMADTVGAALDNWRAEIGADDIHVSPAPVWINPGLLARRAAA